VGPSDTGTAAPCVLAERERAGSLAQPDGNLRLDLPFAPDFVELPELL
jgi:hypothetical protein